MKYHFLEVSKFRKFKKKPPVGHRGLADLLRKITRRENFYTKLVNRKSNKFKNI